MLWERQQRWGLALGGLGGLALLMAGCGGGQEPIAASVDTPTSEAATATATVETATTVATSTAEATYTVQDGDTLYDLAIAWGTTVEAIVALNEIADPNVLKVGQVLKKPQASAQ